MSALEGHVARSFVMNFMDRVNDRHIRHTARRVACVAVLCRDARIQVGLRRLKVNTVHLTVRHRSGVVVARRTGRRDGGFHNVIGGVFPIRTRVHRLAKH